VIVIVIAIVIDENLIMVICTNLSSLVVSVSALRLEGWASIPGRVIPKTLKMGPNASPLGTQHQGLGGGE